VKRYPLPVTFLAGALLLALVPADAAAQRRGGPAHGGRSVVVVRPAYGPFYYGGFYTQPERERSTPAGFGTLAIRIQPRDATVLIDGEEWKPSDGSRPLLIELGPGSHEVEVRKEGFTTYRTTVQVRGAETVALNVSLAR
jgi:hypothetical protein